MAFAAGGIGLLTKVLSVGGAVMSGIGQANAAAYQQSVAEMNQRIAQDNAKRAIERSQVEQQDQDALTREMLGGQLAAQSASGLSVGGKTQQLTRKSAKILGRKDALNVRQAGELEKYNYLSQAANFGSEAKLAGMRKSSGLLSAFLGGARSLVSSATATKKRGSNWSIVT